VEEKTVQIPSISCGHCLMTIKREVAELEGVKSVEGDHQTSCHLGENRPYA
jgi:copper chaperone CopZ